MVAWLLSTVADGTQRHKGHRSVCAPPEILILARSLHLQLPQQISAHVGEEAVSFGGGIWRSENRDSLYCWAVICLTRIQLKNKESATYNMFRGVKEMHLLLFRPLTPSSWTYVVHRTVSVTLRGNHLFSEDPVSPSKGSTVFSSSGVVCFPSHIICNMCAHVDQGVRIFECPCFLEEMLLNVWTLFFPLDRLIRPAKQYINMAHEGWARIKLYIYIYIMALYGKNKGP